MWKPSFAVALLLTSVSSLGQRSSSQGVQVSGSTAQTGDVRSILEQAKTAALNVKYDFQRGLVLDQIGAAEARAGDLSGAVETANRAYPNTMATLTAIGEHFGESNDVVTAKSLGAKLKGGELSTVLAFIADRQAEKGKAEEALHTAAQIQAPEVRSEALTWIARQQAKEGDYAAARKTMGLAKAAYSADRPVSDDVEEVIAEGQLQRGDIQAARATIATMKSFEAKVATLISGVDELLKRSDDANASLWLDDALRGLPDGQKYDFFRYVAIPLHVKLGQKQRAMQAAGALSEELRVKGYAAVAVASAEMKDIDGVNAALGKMQSVSITRREDTELSSFVVKLEILNVTAALIDNGELEAAARLLDSVESHLDDISKISIEREAELQRVVLVAQRGQFVEARALALKMRPNSVADIQRGTALRTITLLQTKNGGFKVPYAWACDLGENEDRAYALLGIAQALLKIDDLKLPYNAIQVH